MKEIGMISREQALTDIEPKQAVSGPVTCMNAEKMHDKTTDGLISRQVAIDIVSGYAEQLNGYIGSPNDSEVYAYARGLILSIERNINAVPSAQPEPYEITDEQAILHLQSTGWMQNHDREMYESGLREQLADDSRGYDSVIPCEDTISRQEAIHIVDGIDTWQSGWRGNAIESMKALPSAQPEPEIYWGYTPTYERPLADMEIVSRLRDIQKQIGGSYAIDRAVEVIAERRTNEPD